MYQIIRTKISKITLLLFTFDFFLILSCFTLAGLIRNILGDFDYYNYVPNNIFCTSVVTTFLFYSNLYNTRLLNAKSQFFLFLSILRPIFYAYISLIIIFYFLPYSFIGRGVLGICCILVCTVLYCWRTLLYSRFFSKKFVKKVIIFGNNDLAQNIKKELSSIKTEYSNIIICETIDNSLENLEKHNCNEIITTLPRLEMDISAQMKLLRQCHFKKCVVLDGMSFYEWLTGKICDETFEDQMAFQNYQSMLYSLTMFLKRICDIILAVFLIICTIPIQIAAMFFIRCTSKGNAIYKQKRVGMHEKEFVMYKFRTMYQNAEEEGPKLTETNDSRIIPFGKFLRKLRIDELPQLINVIKGDMSLIGPRPERHYFTTQFHKKIPWYFLRHSVRPGITGWAQVEYKYANSFEEHYEKLRYDLYYVKNLSLLLDFLIILKTVQVILIGRGK